MAKSVLIPLETSAYDVRTKVANFVAAADVENGQLFAKVGLSADADKSEVYTIAQPATANFLGLWMACSPEDVVVTAENGNAYKVGDLDPRNFVNLTGKVFAGFKPQVDDKILITADGIGGTIASNTFAIAADGEDFLQWGAAAGAGLSFELEKTSYISIAGGFGSQRVTAYQLRCVKN